MKLSRQYIAGFFDGEGCVTMPRRKRSVHPRVSISNTDCRILQILQARYGGSLHQTCRGTGKRKPAWQWGLAGIKAVAFLCDIEPWLIVKHDQAMTAIVWSEARPDDGKWSQWDQPSMDLLVARMKWLNHSGPRVGEDPIDPVLRELQDAGAGAAPL